MFAMLVAWTQRIPGWIRWSAVAGWMVLLFRLSALPGSSVPGRFASLGHLVLYTVLGALIWLAARPTFSSGAALAIAIAAASAYGITDEIHQAFVPGRTPDVLDWAVDTLGALLGAGILAYTARSAERRSSQGRTR